MYLRSKKNENFQSTLPRGSDKINYILIITYVLSIHAPSRERPSARRMFFTSPPFQSTLPRGSDKSRPFFGSHSLRFQSTLPRGSDPYGFNVVGAVTFLSIHAPSRERHAGMIALCCSSAAFNPRSLAGATVDMFRHGTYNRLSIHAPSRERRFLLAFLCSFRSFNPRSLAGATASKQITSLFI